jgi:glycosyltransferase involved in cell wall biosynthesis
MADSLTSTHPRLIIFAPGIHTGGGLVLLKALLQSASLDPETTTLMLDSRVLPLLEPSGSTNILEIHSSLTGRLKAEQQLKKIARSGDTLLCLHSLPPLWRSRAQALCFVQNILHIGKFNLNAYPWKTRLRLHAERLMGRLLKGRVDSYIVQSPSMAGLLKQWHGDSPSVIIAPFASAPAPHPKSDTETPTTTDFIYVADGLPHKNHLNLLEAWVLLAEQGSLPKLTLTLTDRDNHLREQIQDQTRRHGLNIEICQSLSQNQIFDLYRSAKALIYPSFAESLGLPLIEATALDLPIVAAELDYVRDVCQPSQTFDPASPRSIARAVRRFLGQDDPPQPLLSADQFILQILSQKKPSTGDAV